MAQAIRVAPSILAADFARLADEVRKVEPYTDILHLDVMDGHFVPNITFGPALVAAVRKITGLFLDVHLMIDQPGKYIDPFATAGADGITFHIEIDGDKKELIDRIRRLGKKVGVSLNPGTPAEHLESVIDLVDIVLVMSVEAGFGGQEFRDDVLTKITSIRQRRPDLVIEVDGGINESTIPRAVRAGADTMVAGTAVFGADDPGQAVVHLTQVARQANPPK